ncbi:hypothetical protein CYLTODRAFT_404205 [Cylindrobasidium torrendii FP15055 ss-10]|uniref:Methyltransferase-domain-containing protein n=1 Tax=Cylindrobasidium torrendii FP15055 ss-10 TaxID=1314674 RepID=A0A0D7AXN6_9AGAR|nr:hypothetical protein CYLTODRAFT_404205 [Cylindrobasidium torrendii FP15055 ss-10]
MFFYISFLRPPPASVPVAGKVTLVPQVANDLRTEYLPGAQDIYYSWHSGTSQTRGVKLTTWRQDTMYREMNVPLPQAAKDRSHWRLILSPSPQEATINLLDVAQLGQTPFPMLSVPIRIGKGGEDKKQEQIERVYALGTGRIKITEQTSFDLDKKIWDSGIGLSSWLASRKRDGLLPPSLGDALFSTSPRRILELGAGTGIVAITIGALRSADSEAEPPECPAEILTTDLDSAMEILRHNIAANSPLFKAQHCSPVARVLDWDSELPAFTQEGFDAIVMADITYNTASFPSLVKTLAGLIERCRKPPVILLGYKQRDEGERTLWPMLKDVGVELTKLDEVLGAGGSPVEIWMSNSP